MTVARGGKAVYGASVGILLLESRFPRIPGDGGNAGTWPFPMLYRVVGGATPDKVVRDRGGGIVEDFAAAARELVAIGADGITTNCGFLVLYQDRLAQACGVPVAASSLLQVPWVERLLPPGRRVGVVTVEAGSLTPRHLECAGARPDTPVEGTEGGAEFTRVLLGDELELDVDRAARRSSPPPADSSSATATSARSSSNARTCRRTRPRCRARSDSRYTTSTASYAGSRPGSGRDRSTTDRRGARRGK